MHSSWQARGADHPLGVAAPGLHAAPLLNRQARETGGLRCQVAGRLDRPGPAKKHLSPVPRSVAGQVRHEPTKRRDSPAKAIAAPSPLLLSFARQRHLADGNPDLNQ